MTTSKGLSDNLRLYIKSYYSSWKKVSADHFKTCFNNVMEGKATTLKDIRGVIQLKHNFNEFEIDYSKFLNKIQVGKYFLSDIYDDKGHKPELKIAIQNPDVFYQELRSYYINQSDVRVA